MRLVIPALLAWALTPVGGHAQPEGEAFSPSGSHFAVRFPGKPKETTQKVKTAVGELKVHSATYATPEGNVFLASFTDYPAEVVKPENLPTFYAGIREGLAGKDGKVVSEKKITMPGTGKDSGREIVIDKGKVQTRFHVVVKDNRLYQLATVGAGEFVTGKEATVFLNSFEYKP